MLPPQRLVDLRHCGRNAVGRLRLHLDLADAIRSEYTELRSGERNEYALIRTAAPTHSLPFFTQDAHDLERDAANHERFTQQRRGLGVQPVTEVRADQRHAPPSLVFASREEPAVRRRVVVDVEI